MGAGIAILNNSGVAVALVWTSAVLSGLVAIVHGWTPIDIGLVVLLCFFAIWYGGMVKGPEGGAGMKTIKLSIAAPLLIGIFVAGFFLGRAFPAHHYERFGNGPFLLDTSTGTVCDARLSDPSDPFAEFGGHRVDGPSAQNDPYAEFKSRSPYQPCHK